MFELTLVATAFGLSFFGLSDAGVVSSTNTVLFENETVCIEYVEAAANSLPQGTPPLFEFVDICVPVEEQTNL